jgi:restriction system protein
MALWLVRAGSHGEREATALEQGIALIGWEELPDLSRIQTREGLAKLLKQTYPDEKHKTLLNWESQIWPFLGVIKEGDRVALPLKTRAAVAIGKVKGPYQYRPQLPPDARHTRPVQWLKELPRSAFDQDLLYSLGAFMTVCRIQRNNAEERILALLDGQAPSKPALPAASVEATSDAEAPPDIEQFAKDQIRDFIGQKFKSHDLAHLVGSLLEAQGYKVRIAPEGPDGGVDIIAGKGLLGFDPPRLAVQVKSGSSPVDVKVLRELQGVMKNFGAEQGLIVAWGGYTNAVQKEAARLFFEIRLWDSGDLVQMIQTHYEGLPDALQAELPLKRIWTLVPSED